jgi:hypothetical protein
MGELSPPEIMNLLLKNHIIIDAEPHPHVDTQFQEALDEFVKFLKTHISAA